MKFVKKWKENNKVKVIPYFCTSFYYRQYLDFSHHDNLAVDNKILIFFLSLKPLAIEDCSLVGGL